MLMPTLVLQLLLLLQIAYNNWFTATVATFNTTTPRFPTKQDYTSIMTTTTTATTNTGNIIRLRRQYGSNHEWNKIKCHKNTTTEHINKQANKQINIWERCAIQKRTRRCTKETMYWCSTIDVFISLKFLYSSCKCITNLSDLGVDEVERI